LPKKTKEESPSMEIIDFKSVKTSHHIDFNRGIDGNKKTEEQKEHIIVDTLDIQMSLKIQPANIQG
jgi:putative transposase